MTPRQRPAEYLPAPHLISDEPLINAAHRILPDLAFAGYLLLLVYGSFVPFDFGPPLRPPPQPHLIAGMAIGPLRLTDIVFNILIYVPTGAGLYAILRHRRSRTRRAPEGFIASLISRAVAGMIAVAVAALLSYFVERAQGMVRSRVSTWVDVAANVIGALLGVNFAILCESKIRDIAEATRRRARANFLSAATCVIIGALFLIHLRPYDVAVDLFHTATRTVRTANVSPLAGWNQLPMVLKKGMTAGRMNLHDVTRIRCDYLLDQISEAGSYALLTVIFLFSRIRAAEGRFRWRRFALRDCLSAGALTVSLSATITLMRIFLASRGLDVTHVLCGTAGWVFGVLLTILVIRQDGTAPSVTGLLPRSLCRPAMALMVVTLLAFELVPFDFGQELGRFQSARSLLLVPFLNHFRGCPAAAVQEISGDLLRYGLLSAILAVLFHEHTRFTWRGQFGLCVASSMLLAALFETAQLWMPSRSPDITSVLLAGAGGFAGAIAVRWTRDCHRTLSEDAPYASLST